MIYPSTLSFRADIPHVMKVVHICPYYYTNDSHIQLPLQKELTYTFYPTEVKKLVLNFNFLTLNLKKFMWGIYDLSSKV